MLCSSRRAHGSLSPRLLAVSVLSIAAACGGGGGGDGGFTAGPIRGTAFLDANRNGIQDPGEAGLASLAVRILGAFGVLDRSFVTAADGTFVASELPGGRFLVDVVEEPGFWPTFGTLEAVPDPNPGFPEVADRRSRIGNTRGFLARAAQVSVSDPLVHVSLGDSVGFGTNACGSENGAFGYGGPFTSRLDLAVRSAAWQPLAVPGFRTSDLLRRPPTCPPNPNAECPKQQPPPAYCCGSLDFAASFAPDVVTIHISGNDLNPSLNTQDEAATSLALARVRQDLQEILSGMQALVPGVQIVLNVLYDNEQGAEPFRSRWLPVIDQVLRDLALGQDPPAVVSEVYAEYAHRDAATQQILGEQKLICVGTSEPDGVHPNNTGYLVHVEKLWDAVGGTENVLGASPDLSFGLLQRLDTRFPTATQDLGLGVTNPTAALVLDGAGALVPPSTGTFRLFKFDSSPNGFLAFARVVVAYRTTAPPGVDDAYGFEASLDGTFAAPGTTMQTWNTVVPIVGGSGVGGGEILVAPDVPAYRTVSAALTKGAPVDGTPTLSWSDLQNLVVRFRGLPGPSGPAPYQIEWDAAWIETYGIPPGELIWDGDPSPGGEVTIRVTGREGDRVEVDVAEALTAVPVTVPPHEGAYRLDATRLIRTVSGTVGHDGSFAWRLPVPADGSRSGRFLYVQALRLPRSSHGAGVLTAARSIRLP